MNRSVSQSARCGGEQEQSQSGAAPREMVTPGCCVCSNLQVQTNTTLAFFSSRYQL